MCIVESSAYISALQFEILKGRSFIYEINNNGQSIEPQTALINIIDKWIEEMNNGNVNVVILLDLKKAFDVVVHDIMAKKLEIYGFNKNSSS
jgi:hypothetical protein